MQLFSLRILLLFFFSAVFLFCKGQDNANEPDSEKVFTTVEEMPKYPGGDAALMKFMKEKIEYATNHCSGKVYLAFVINETGEIHDSKILKGLNDDCNYQAVWIINSMPNWEPGRHNGRLVKVQYNMVVDFK